jgi:hypothetical protein
MRLFSKIFFILSLLSVLYALSPHPIYALACSGTGYTCRKFDCAVGEVEDTSRICTLYDYICCKKVPTSTNQHPKTRRLTHASSWWDGMFYHRPMLPRLLRPQQHPNSCLLLRLHQRPLLHHPPRHKPHHHRCFLSKLQRLRPLEWMYVWTKRLWRLCFPRLYLPGALLHPSPNLQPVSDLLRLQSTSRRWRRYKSHQYPGSNNNSNSNPTPDPHWIKLKKRLLLKPPPPHPTHPCLPSRLRCR